MAKGRMLLASLSTSRKFAALSRGGHPFGEFCQALFPLIVANCDDAGGVEGEAVSVKCKLYPCSTRSEEDFEAAITRLQEVGLVTLAEEEGRRYLYVVGFAKTQTGLKKKRPRSAGPKAEMPLEDWLESLAAKPAYQGINIGHLYDKMIVWCETKGQTPTRQRFVNWLNREPKPVQALATTNGQRPLPPKMQASLEALENWRPKR